MSLKNGPELVDTPIDLAVKKSASIAWRLTLWYALLSIILIVVAGSVMYWVLSDRLRQEDDELLSGRIAELRSILLLHPPDSALFREAVQSEAAKLPVIQVRVLDSQGGIVIEAPAHPAAIFDRRGFADRHPQYPEDERGKDWIATDGIYRVKSAHVAVGAGYTMQVAMSRSEEEELLTAYRRILWLAISSVLVVAVAAGYLIARREMRPVARLAAIIADLSAAHLHRRIGDDEWPKELRPLARNFDRLLVRLEESFARISQFSADIAHELRTPLHILQGEAEIALTKACSNDEYRACIESAAEEYQRLARMVDALLFLARAEQPGAQVDKKLLLLDREISAVCAFYQAMADEQAVALVTRGSGHVMADVGLLRRALGNLIANSLRHTPSGGQIVVEARESPDHAAEIVVSDTGEGISPEDLAHVFDRFYRADSARARAGAGTGLGLAIVKFIMQLHAGTTSIKSELHRGTTITLTFPAAHIGY